MPVRNRHHLLSNPKTPAQTNCTRTCCLFFFSFFFFKSLTIFPAETCSCRYMIVLIFMKWSIDWEYRMGIATCDLDTGFTSEGIACDETSTTADMCPLDYGGSGDGCQPPNLITSLINIALSPGSVDEPMYGGQAGVQARGKKCSAFCLKQTQYTTHPGTTLPPPSESCITSCT